MHFVYIVRCADGSLYTGYARDPEQRVIIHNSRKGAKYTASRTPVRLVYQERCESLSAALKREHEIKKWSRTKKQALVKTKVRGVSRRDSQRRNSKNTC